MQATRGPRRSGLPECGCMHAVCDSFLHSNAVHRPFAGCSVRPHTDHVLHGLPGCGCRPHADHAIAGYPNAVVCDSCTRLLHTDPSRAAVCSYTRTTFCTGYPDAGAAVHGPRRSGLPGYSSRRTTPEAGYPATASRTRTTLRAGYPDAATHGPRRCGLPGCGL